ncbi:ATP-binding protein [Microbulbifer sp. SAOS-129_SWC]|uniref:ATP-binding protein n=1 Tax=Microbulbifer sp. SAOS-129_SWC TaxID=3145235 RepID=UPI0032170465
MKSIRVFLLIALLSTIVLVNFVSAVHGYRASMAEAQQLFDRQMAASARLLAAMPAPQAAPLVVAQTGQQAFQVWSDGGRQLLVRSANAPDQPLGTFAEGYRELNFSGYRWRVLCYFVPQSNRRVLVAERIDLRYALADRVILASVLPILLGIPVAGILIWLVVGRGLRSLRQLAAALRDKRAEDLSPLPLAQPPEELQPVVNSTNALLARLRASFERERRFSADAAHELRTPISAIQVHAHNLQQELQQCQLPQPPESLCQLQSSVERMAHLVEQMLNLYRTTPDHYPMRFEPIDLHRLAQEVIAENYRVFADRNQSIELSGGGASVAGDRFALSILLKNLLSNANKYTPVGGRIEVALQERGERVTLRVDDSGVGLDEAEYQRIFERFYRVGGDRHVTGAAGCGLGLSIVEHIAQLHGASIRLAPSKFGQGLSVQIEFPRRAGTNAGEGALAAADGEQTHG